MIKEAETRFGTYYHVAERFLKSAVFVHGIFQSQNKPNAMSAYDAMKKTTDKDRNITGFPGVEAIYDAFGIMMECVERFEVSSRPTIHIALPMIYKAMKNLDDIADGGQVWRESINGMVQPSIYSRIHL